MTLKGRTVEKTVEPVVGQSILDIAKKHRIDWGFMCTRGTCARCRCLVSEGMDRLSEVNDVEWMRMEEEEFEQGYRLACQAVVEKEGTIRAENKPYF